MKVQVQITAAGCRAARGLLKWSMRDLQEASGVSLPTILKLEKGEGVSDDTARRLCAAFFRFGVEFREDGAVPRIWRETGGKPVEMLALLKRELEYVSIRPRADGTVRVLFEVPPRLRPPEWLPTIPLPFTGIRRGRLDDPDEVERIRRDARSLRERLERARQGLGA